MDLVCRRCQRPVRVSAELYDVFEQMHYVCFHFEFEHDNFDVDEECRAGGCPSASLSGGRDKVIAVADELALEAAADAPWSNSMTHEYLSALAGWLRDHEGYYLNKGSVPPGNGWVVVAEALRAATVYE